jgi:hypothetical protein
MSSTQKFNVGDSAKVMSDDKAYDEVRDKILTLIEWYDDGDNIVWYVDYAGKPNEEYFACWERDLAMVNVKVVEGRVYVEQYRSGYIVNLLGSTDYDLADVFERYEGDEVRVTIETIRKATIA